MPVACGPHISGFVANQITAAVVAKEGRKELGRKEGSVEEFSKVILIPPLSLLTVSQWEKFECRVA